ncbi:MAG: hypothetical protein IPK63_14385 [Candidatus Competibacteraceae bacterium]|nr:hypothetical protein [Candidatus Competibacteraceae bacterium]
MPQKLWLYTSHLSLNNVLTLKVFLGLTKNDEVAIWEYTENPAIAAALLVDADSEDGKLQLKEWIAKGKSQVLIAFSQGAEGLPENVLMLPRPLRLAELITVLKQAAKRFLGSSSPQEEQKSTTVVQSGGVSEKTGDISAPTSPKIRRVFEVLCGNRDKVLKVFGGAAQPVVFDISRRRYYPSNDAGQIEIENLLTSAARRTHIEEININQLAKETQNLKGQELDVPLWAAALAASSGQLFDGLFRDEFFRLNRWPDLKKLGQNPLHLKLTALLRHGGTIDHFADIIKVPTGDIINFINACYALNYLDHQTKPAVQNKVPLPEQINANKRSLLSRIRSRLGI